MWLVTMAMERWQTFCCKTMPKSTPEQRWVHICTQCSINIYRYSSCVFFQGLIVFVCLSLSRTGTLLCTKQLSRATLTSSTCCFNTEPQPTTSRQWAHNTKWHRYTRLIRAETEIKNAVWGCVCVFHLLEWEHCSVHCPASWVHLCGGHSEARDWWKPYCHGETWSFIQYFFN